MPPPRCSRATAVAGARGRTPQLFAAAPAAAAVCRVTHRTELQPATGAGIACASFGAHAIGSAGSIGWAARAPRSPRAGAAGVASQPAGSGRPDRRPARHRSLPRRRRELGGVVLDDGKTPLARHRTRPPGLP